MEVMLTAVSKVYKANKARSDDDIADRLNHQYTVMFLVVFTAIITATQFIGSPITCWCPAYFTDNHIDYAKKVRTFLDRLVGV
jgi:hypothetical protein